MTDIKREERIRDALKQEAMNPRAFLNKLEMLKAQALAIVRASSPYKTGELSRSFQIRLIDGGFEIYTNKDYMVYTEEKWVSPRWRGRKNPNEKWFKETAEFIARYIAQQLGGQYVS